MGQSDLREQILANAEELMCKINPDTAHVKVDRLVVRRCGKGDNKGYKAVIIDFAIIRMEGPKGRSRQEALEGLFDLNANQLKRCLGDYEDMKFSHIKGEELGKVEGGGKVARKVKGGVRLR